VLRCVEAGQQGHLRHIAIMIGYGFEERWFSALEAGQHAPAQAVCEAHGSTILAVLPFWQFIARLLTTHTCAST
jgi:hypothetical protein